MRAASMMEPKIEMPMDESMTARAIRVMRLMMIQTATVLVIQMKSDSVPIP